MQLTLQYTNNLDREYIKEAAKFKNEGEARVKKWKFAGDGLYKSTYKKGNIIVKFASGNNGARHLLDEIKCYKQTKRKYKKHLARIFGGDEKKIIQRFIPFNPNALHTEKDIQEMRYLATKMGINDIAPDNSRDGNATKLNGKVIFYDYGGY